ncbi:MAG: hypothetical protein K1X89_24525 [Myxococcaceae bacterium]|nr:hypothetical protein [Myxococcaceae bacterium]
MKRALLVSAVALLAGCSRGAPEVLTLTDVSPKSALEGTDVEIVISGEGLHPRAFTDFSDPHESRLLQGYSAQLGTTSLRHLSLDADGKLHALVPAGIAPGSYELKVVDPWRQEASLPAAFEVLSFESLDALVVGYRVAPIEPQHVFTPFNIQVVAVDAQGADVKPFNGSVLLEDLTHTLVPAASGSFALGRWGGKVEVRGAHAGDVITVRDAQGRTGASNAFAVATGAAAAINFVTPERTAPADTCSKDVTVQLVDGIGAVAVAESPTALSLSSAGLDVFSDEACTVPLSQPAIEKGQSQLTFRFKGLAAGVFPLVAASRGLRSGTQQETITAGAAARLGFATPARATKAGECSLAVEVQAQDAFGNAAALTGPAQVTLGAPTQLAVFDDAACSHAATTVTLPAGKGSTPVYVRGTAAGDWTLTASATGFTSGSQVETVLPADANHLAFTSAPQSRIVGACSAMVGVEARDTFDNPAPGAAARTVGLTPSNGAVALFLDAACSQPASSVSLAAGSAQAGFFFKGSAVGAYSVAAASTGLTGASQAITITLAPADRLVFLTSSQTLVAGNCSAVVQVQARDMNGVPAAVTSDTAVALTAGSGGAFFSDAACSVSASTATIATGAHTTSFFFRGTVAGALMLSAQVSGWAPVTQTETILAGPKDRLAFITPQRSVVAGACSPAVTIGITDALGNTTSSMTPVTVNLTASPGSSFGLFSDAACTLPVSSVVLGAGSAGVSVHFRGSAAAQVVLSATASGLGGATQDALVRPEAPTTLVFVTPPRTATAGSCSGVLTVQAQDGFGNPSVVAAAASIAVTPSPSGGVTFYSDGSCTLAVTAVTLAAGADSASFHFRSTAAGTLQLTATTQGWTAAQSEVVQPGPASQLTFDPIASPQGNRAAFSVSLRARDAWGNLTPAFTGPATLLMSPSGTLTCESHCAAADTTGPFVGGVWKGTVSVDSVGTARRLVATAGALLGSSNAFDVPTPPVRSPPRAKLTVSPAAVVVGQAVTFSATLSRDDQTAQAALEASFDFTGAAVGDPPWTAFSTSQVVSQSFGAPGLYEARVAVRDADGDLGYATALVQVVASAASLCTVTTASMTDDGATACSGSVGTDGQLSLAEAVRLANAGSGLTITFSGPMAVQGASRLALTSPMTVLGGDGVSVELPLDVEAAVTLGDLELTGTSSASAVSASGALTLTDVQVRDSAGWVNRGTAALEQVEFRGCSGDCLTDDGSAALTVRFSRFLSSSAHGLVVASCAGGAPAIDVQSSTFSGLKTGIRSTCARPLSILNATFDRNERAVEYSSGSGNVLRGSLFTNHSLSAVSCGGATFTTRDTALVFQNASDGCVAGDPGGLSGDPLYLSRAAKDLRVAPGSPAVDSAVDLGRDVNGPGPGHFFGAAPDRGGAESG